MNSEARLNQAPASIADQCEEVGVLGYGAYGVVRKVVWKEDGELYALKTMSFPLDDAAKRLAEAEVQFSQTLDHENIISCRAAEVGGKHDKAYLLMDYAEGGDVAEVLVQHLKDKTRIPLDKAWSYFIQTAKALRYLHDPSQRKDGDVDGPLGHGDIKPENLLLADREQNDLRLADMGFMQHYPRNQLVEVQHGTDVYMAPEIWNKGVADERADCYSLGMVGFELLSGFHPHAGMSEVQLRFMHARKSPYPRVKPDYKRDLDFALLVIGLMDYDPDRRLSISELFENPKFQAKMKEDEAARRMRSLAKLENRLAELKDRHARICKATDDIFAGLDEQLAIKARIERALLERCQIQGLSECAVILPVDSPIVSSTPPLTRKALESLNAMCNGSTARVQAHPAASAHSSPLTPPNTSDEKSFDMASFDGTWSSVCSPLSSIYEASISEATWGSSISVIDLTDSTAPEPLQASLQSAFTDRLGSAEIALPSDALERRKGTRVAQLIADSKDIQYHTILHSAFQQTKSELVARLRRMLAHLGMSSA